MNLAFTHIAKAHCPRQAAQKIKYNQFAMEVDLKLHV